MTGKAVRILLSAVVVLTAALFTFTLCRESAVSRSLLSCTKVEIEVADSARLGFVTADDIRRILAESCPPVTGRKLDSVDLAGIEKVLNARGAVQGAQAWTTGDGTVHVSVSQRNPVLLLRRGSDSWYADSEGYLFPKSKDVEISVPTVDGDIPLGIRSDFRGMPEAPKEKAWLEGMLRMSRFLQGNKEWRRAIREIKVDSGGELVLYPVKGKERFLFGRPEDFESKFARMEDYYRYIVPARGEDYYSSVNVKFDGQIVCKEK